ncbi:protein translocase subunit SecD [Hyphobacterium indicum]|jgi:preprotein translocase subunit SecD|uniref:protein translocase subunit SecD n=1 Tax=Hyphobacterium indicum TaxID=2162714 RepID=UPI000D654389|nr:protein translocase subunit SecD [Hyphobacterium indicum]
MLYFAHWKIALILAVSLLGIWFAAPNFSPLPGQTVNLGLDLQGGSHLVFEVDLPGVRAERLDGLSQEATVLFRQQPTIPTAANAVIGDEVVIRVARAEDMDEAFSRLQSLSRPVGDGSMGLTGVAARTVDFDRDNAERTIRMSLTDAAMIDIRDRTIAQSIEVIRRRIDASGTTEPTIARQGDERILVQVPGESNPQRIIELVGTTARMTFHLVRADVAVGADGQGRTPPGVMILQQDDLSEPYIAVERRAMVSGENLTYAGSTFQDGQPVVEFRFDTTGAAAFGRVTSQNVGRRFAVVLDDIVISSPVILGPILGGSGVIQGNFTFESAYDLAVLLQAGALPAELTVVEQRSVGPGLGQDSINKGTIAVVIGFIAVMVFMLAAYSVFGVFSNLALMLNVMLILGALSGLQATLTLPGIAGIILTIGMAVDANVLIYERIREEAKNGRSPANAIEKGYSEALSAILDANITTLIAAGVLYMLGAGPVRGFAVTLGIGIITSVFTAFVFSRLLVAMWVKGLKPKKLPI